MVHLHDFSAICRTHATPRELPTSSVLGVIALFAVAMAAVLPVAAQDCAECDAACLLENDAVALLEAYTNDKRGFAVRTGRCAETDPIWNEIFNNVYDLDRTTSPEDRGSSRLNGILAEANGLVESCMRGGGSGSISVCRAEAGRSVARVIAPNFSPSNAVAGSPRGTGRFPAEAVSPTYVPSGGFPPILAVPRYEADESTTGAFAIDLADGSAHFIDRIKISPPSHRRRTLPHNVFAILDRAAGVPAQPGEIVTGEIRSTRGATTGLFMVDTSTGAAAYLDGLEDEPYGGTIRPVNGRPAEAIASNDGNFALIMRRDGAGGTDGAYLYHATTGQCIYFAHVDEMDPNPTVMFATSLPKMEGRVAAIALQDGSEATPEALLVDEISGAIYRVGELERAPAKTTVAQQPLGLFEFFPETTASTPVQRFVLVPGFSDNGATDSVFVVDAATGKMAVLKDVRQGGAMHLVGSTQNLFTHLPDNGGAARFLAAAPKVGRKGTTDGAWVFAPSTSGLWALEKIRGPQRLKIYRVEQVSN